MMNAAYERDFDEAFVREIARLFPDVQISKSATVNVFTSGDPEWTNLTEDQGRDKVKRILSITDNDVATNVFKEICHKVGATKSTQTFNCSG